MRSLRTQIRQLYVPITRRIDGVLWRLDLMRSQSADNHRSSILDAEQTRGELLAGFAALTARLDQIELKIQEGQELQVESAAYVGRLLREEPAANVREPSA